jgi:hypothetical protein
VIHLWKLNTPLIHYSFEPTSIILRLYFGYNVVIHLDVILLYRKSLKISVIDPIEWQIIQILKVFLVWKLKWVSFHISPDCLLKLFVIALSLVKMVAYTSKTTVEVTTVVLSVELCNFVFVIPLIRVVFILVKQIIR